jgi:hypothetical protein
MTKLCVESGICGFKVIVTTTMKEDGKQVAIALESDCEMVKELAMELTELDKMTVFTGFTHNPVYTASSKCLKHTACPVPSGIIKAIEVEAGLCLPKEVKIEFID